MQKLTKWVVDLKTITTTWKQVGTSNFLSCVREGIQPFICWFPGPVTVCREDIIYLKTCHGATLSSLWVTLHKGRIKQCQVVRLSNHLGGDGQTTRHSGRINRALTRWPQAISHAWTISLQYTSSKCRGWSRWNVISKSCIDLGVY